MAGAPEEEVKTLFLSGLPDDIKEREIYNLFRTFKGYESCQLKYSGRGYQIVAFAVFSDQGSALAAKEALNGLKFDLQTGATLHIELARANSRTKRSRSEDGGVGAVEKKYRGPIGTPGTFPDPENQKPDMPMENVGVRLKPENPLGGIMGKACLMCREIIQDDPKSDSHFGFPGVGGTVHMPGMVHSVYNDMSGFPPPQSGSLMGPKSYPGQDSLPGMMLGPALIPPPPAPGSNPPCSTLFIANLGQTCTEDELTKVLARFPGYRKIKMQIKGGLPVAFVEFQDIMCSTQALSQLQNSMLSSSDRGGMRLEYAKAKMGQPRRERLSGA